MTEQSLCIYESVRNHHCDFLFGIKCGYEEFNTRYQCKRYIASDGSRK